MTKDVLNAAFLDVFVITGVPALATRWRSHQDEWRTSAGRAWLEAAGGIGITHAQTDMDLLILASQAPSDLLFGLAYGKYADALANASMGNAPCSAHHIAFTGPYSPVGRALQSSVLSRGHAFDLSIDEREDPAIDLAGFARSSSGLVALDQAGSVAGCSFLVGQISSWAMTAHRIARRDTSSHDQSTPHGVSAAHDESCAYQFALTSRCARRVCAQAA